MPYDPVLVQPMRDELTSIGAKELTTAAEVDRFMAQKAGSALVVVNSVCGCAAANARPAVRMALQGPNKPDRVATVFAGQDLEATARFRGLVPDLPPSSPSMFLFKDGELVHAVPRHRIEGRDAPAIAAELVQGFEMAKNRSASGQGPSRDSAPATTADTRERIEAVLDKIRPAVQADGGNVEFVDFDDADGTVMIKLVGACVGCPSSLVTLKMGIEETLKEEVPSVRQVEAVS